MTPCRTRNHRIAAGLLLLAVCGCQPTTAVPRDHQPDRAAPQLPDRPLAPIVDDTLAGPPHVAPRDPAPIEPTPYVDVTLDAAVRDEPVGVLSRADLDLLVTTHPLVQQHLAAHPEQALGLHARIDEALALPSSPRVFFVAVGQRVAFPLTQIVAFRAEALVKLPDGSLATQALVVSAPAVSFGIDPEPGLLVGVVSAPTDVPVSLSAVDASVFWANGLRNPSWSAYWEGHQEILTSAAGIDLLLGNLGFQKIGPLELVVSGAIATLDRRSLPRLLRAPGEDLEPLWWQADPAGAPAVIASGDLRARLADGVLTLEEDGEVLWSRPVTETQLVAVDAQAGRVIVAGAHGASVYRLAGTLEARFPFGADDGTAGEVVLQDYDPTSACDNLQSLISLCGAYALKYGMIGWAALSVYYSGWAQYYTAIWQSLGCGE